MTKRKTIKIVVTNLLRPFVVLPRQCSRCCRAHVLSVCNRCCRVSGAGCPLITAPVGLLVGITLHVRLRHTSHFAYFILKFGEGFCKGEANPKTRSSSNFGDSANVRVGDGPSENDAQREIRVERDEYSPHRKRVGREAAERKIAEIKRKPQTDNRHVSR